MSIHKLFNVLIVQLILISVLDRILVIALRILSIIKQLIYVLKIVGNLISTINILEIVKSLMQLLLPNLLLLKAFAQLISQYGIMLVKSVSYALKVSLITAKKTQLVLIVLKVLTGIQQRRNVF